jgi:hypothetical protein
VIGQKNRGVVSAALQRNNCLPGNTDFFRQVLLRKTVLFPQQFDFILNIRPPYG